MRVIYLDTLFLLNFSVDYLLLLLTARLRGVYSSWGRLLAGAALGALCAVVLFFLPLSLLPALLAWAAVCVGMVLCVFGLRQRDDLPRLCAALLLLTTLLAGCVYGLMQFSRGLTMQNGVVYYQVSGPLLAVGMVMLFGLCALVLGRGRASAGRTCREIRVQQGEVSVRFRALLDSGNLLRDPISGRRVIVTECETAAPLLGMGEGELRALLTTKDTASALDCLRCRTDLPLWLLPFRTAAREGLLVVFRPERLLVDGEPCTDQLLGLTAASLKIGGDCHGLIGV